MNLEQLYLAARAGSGSKTSTAVSAGRRSDDGSTPFGSRDWRSQVVNSCQQMVGPLPPSGQVRTQYGTVTHIKDEAVLAVVITLVGGGFHRKSLAALVRDV
ncbi:hypothetical protein [Streptomyces sp. NPDC051569]|uniref:hypothetical protein n=1 Tax=Streptomyces sp. NPDC051569 TaxID=3365661 RepID=UPI00379DE7A0